MSNDPDDDERLPIDEVPVLNTVREKFLKAISGNPRWQAATKSGRAFVIVGAKPERRHISLRWKSAGRENGSLPQTSAASFLKRREQG
jgi:hypothetical protein